MSKAKESLKAALIASGLSDEFKASAYVESIDDQTAKKMLLAVMEGMGGTSRNLPTGEGGVIAGLRNVVDSRRIDAELDLPDAPHELSREKKRKTIEAFSEDIETGNKKFADGLRNLLLAKTAERTDAMETWAVELSDADFPVAMQRIQENSSLSAEKITAALQEVLANEADAINKAMLEHNDISDNKSKGG